MGFLKTLLLYLITTEIIIAICGCSFSVINIESYLGSDPYSMFGKTTERTFYYPITISDSMKKKWHAEINGGFPNSSVSFCDKYVFVNDLSGRVYCFNIDTGEKIGKLKNKGYVYSTPVIDQNLLIYVCAIGDENASYLYYYDLRKSQSIREVKITGRVLTELLKTKRGIIFTTENGIVYCYDFFGEKLWETNTGEVAYSSPAQKDSTIVFGNNKGEIISVNAVNGKLQYRVQIGGCFFGGATIKSSDVFLGDDNGNLYSINYESGKLNWSLCTGSKIRMTPVFDGSNVYVGNLHGDFFSIGKTSGKINWQNKLGSLFNITPVVTNNYIILPDQNEKLYFVDKNSGIIKKTYRFEGRMKLSPVIKNNNILLIGYDNGVLEAYEICK
jgi:eukaryotic-like serine/threonine-protein kinase